MTLVLAPLAAARGITVPSQLRAEIRKDGRDLVGAFRTLAPARVPIRIQRWSVRRLAVTVGVLLGAAIAVSLGPVFPRPGVLPGQAAPAVAGDVQDHVQHSGDS
jgi:hypothetical protein